MTVIGKLRNKISFESVVEVVDDFGQPNRTWSNIDNVWSEKTVANASERVKADQLDNVIVYSFVIRFRTDITPNQRIKQGSTYFTIHSVVDKLGDKTWLQVIATEIQQGETGTI